MEGREASYNKAKTFKHGKFLLFFFVINISIIMRAKYQTEDARLFIKKNRRLSS